MKEQKEKFKTAKLKLEGVQKRRRREKQLERQIHAKEHKGP